MRCSSVAALVGFVVVTGGCTAPAPFVDDGGLDGGIGASSDAGTSADAGAPAEDAGTPDGGRRAPADASVTSLGSCDAGFASLAAPSRCEALEVTCEGLPPARVELVITEPPVGTAARGVLVFGEGGAGTDFTASGRALDGGLVYREGLRRLVLSGYIVVDRRWPGGWFGQLGLGIGTPSCRYATLLRHLEQTLSQGRPMCATGNSGGASELAYALTRWDGAERLRLAVLSGGPPMASLDVGCFGDAVSSTWRQDCATEWARTQTECPPATPPRCTLRDRPFAAAPALVDTAYATANEPRPCTAGSPTAQGALAADSVDAPDALTTFPRTRVRFLVGRMDCTEGPLLGMRLRRRLTSAIEERVIAGMRHPVADTAAGVDAVVAALADCAP